MILLVVGLLVVVLLVFVFLVWLVVVSRCCVLWLVLLVVWFCLLLCLVVWFCLGVGFACGCFSCFACCCVSRCLDSLGVGFAWCWFSLWLKLLVVEVARG